MSKKEFKYTIKTKKGLILAEQIVSFGSEEYPFPENWKESGMAQRSLYEYKEEFLNAEFDVDISEDLEFSIEEGCTARNISNELMKTKQLIEEGENPIDDKPLRMDLSDIGNTIGIEIQKAIERGEGTWEDFIRGLNHGKSLIDETH